VRRLSGPKKVFQQKMLFKDKKAGVMVYYSGLKTHFVVAGYAKFKQWHYPFFLFSI